MYTFDEIDPDALLRTEDPPLDRCMAAAVKRLLLSPSPAGWKYDADSRSFQKDMTEEVWCLCGDMRGYPQPVTFCGCKIDGRYDHWEDRTFYGAILPEDCAAPEAQALLALLRTIK